MPDLLPQGYSGKLDMAVLVQKMSGNRATKRFERIDGVIFCENVNRVAASVRCDNKSIVTIEISRRKIALQLDIDRCFKEIMGFIGLPDVESLYLADSDTMLSVTLKN